MDDKSDTVRMPVFCRDCKHLVTHGSPGYQPPACAIRHATDLDPITGEPVLITRNPRSTNRDLSCVDYIPKPLPWLLRLIARCATWINRGGGC